MFLLHRYSPIGLYIIQRIEKFKIKVYHQCPDTSVLVTVEILKIVFLLYTLSVYKTQNPFLGVV